MPLVTTPSLPATERPTLRSLLEFPPVIPKPDAASSRGQADCECEPRPSLPDLSTYVSPQAVPGRCRPDYGGRRSRRSQPSPEILRQHQRKRQTTWERQLPAARAAAQQQRNRTITSSAE